MTTAPAGVEGKQKNVAMLAGITGQNEMEKESDMEPELKRDKLEMAFKILSGIQDQIRFADSKAAFLVAFMALTFGYISSKGSVLFSQWPVCAISIIYVLVSLTTVILSVMVVRSRFGIKGPQTLVFFDHIAKTVIKRKNNIFPNIFLHCQSIDQLRHRNKDIPFPFQIPQLHLKF